MEVFLHKIGGKEVPKPVRAELRRCTAAEAPAVYALQNEVRAAMPDPSQFVPDTLENTTAYVQKDLCIGMWQGKRLGAYAIVRFCGESEHNYAAFLGIPACGMAALGQRGQCHRPPGLPRQRPAAAHAASGAAAFPGQYHPHRGHRQPRESIQSAQRSCVRLCHCGPAGDVWRL